MALLSFLEPSPHIFARNTHTQQSDSIGVTSMKDKTYAYVRRTCHTNFFFLFTYDFCVVYSVHSWSIFIIIYVIPIGTWRRGNGDPAILCLLHTNIDQTSSVIFCFSFWLKSDWTPFAIEEMDGGAHSCQWLINWMSWGVRFFHFFNYIFLSFVRLTVTNSLEDVARNQVKISKQFNDPDKIAKLPSDSSRYYITSKYNKQNTRVLRVYV